MPLAFCAHMGCVLQRSQVPPKQHAYVQEQLSQEAFGTSMHLTMRLQHL